MAVTQNERLEAVLSKLESVENELRQCKRIIQYFKLNEDQGDSTVAACVSPPETPDEGEFDEAGRYKRGPKAGLFPGQLSYLAGEDPVSLAVTKKKIETEEAGTCAT